MTDVYEEEKDFLEELGIFTTCVRKTDKQCLTDMYEQEEELLNEINLFTVLGESTKLAFSKEALLRCRTIIKSLERV